jgi:hypothetical protein
MSFPPSLRIGNTLRLSSVTPVYGLSTDGDQIVICDDVRVTRASEEHLQVLDPDDIFVQHIRLYRPHHLLWKTVYLAPDQVAFIVEFSKTLTDDLWRGDAENNSAHLSYILPVSRLLRAFQLFRPGRLVAGDTSFFFRSQDTGCRTLSLVRCSEMSIDF